MNPLAPLRRAPWLSGAVVLVLVVGLLAPAAWALGLRRWPYYVGLVAGALLALGAFERLWQRRALVRPPRARRKLRLLSGRKGNGQSHDLASDDPTDKQRWLM
jgi:hypothetical protein